MIRDVTCKLLSQSWRSIWDHSSMVLSIVTALVRNLAMVPTAVLRSHVAKDAEVLALRHENAVLRRQIARVRYEPADRIWLAALSRLVPRDRWREVFAVTPTTLLRWHRELVKRKWTFAQHCRRPGRPSTAPTVKQLILRLARENSSWGHRRIRGELARLGYSIAPSSGRSCTLLASILPHSDPARPGASSSPPRPAASSLPTSCTSTPCPSSACTP